MMMHWVLSDEAPSQAEATSKVYNSALAAESRLPIQSWTKPTHGEFQQTLDPIPADKL